MVNSIRAIRAIRAIHPSTIQTLGPWTIADFGTSSRQFSWIRSASEDWHSDDLGVYQPELPDAYSNFNGFNDFNDFNDFNASCPGLILLCLSCLPSHPYETSQTTVLASSRPGQLYLMESHWTEDAGFYDHVVHHVYHVHHATGRGRCGRGDHSDPS